MNFSIGQRYLVPMHAGKKNPNFEYKMKVDGLDVTIAKCEKEKKFG